jgi:hypothetical protein
MLEVKLESIFKSGIRAGGLDIILESLSSETWKKLGDKHSRGPFLLVFLMRLFILETNRENQVTWMVKYPVRAGCASMNAWMLHYAYAYSFLDLFLGAMDCIAKTSPELVKESFKLMIQFPLKKRMPKLESQLSKEELSQCLTRGSMYYLITLLASAFSYAGISLYLTCSY